MEVCIKIIIIKKNHTPRPAWPPCECPASARGRSHSGFVRAARAPKILRTTDRNGNSAHFTQHLPRSPLKTARWCFLTPPWVRITETGNKFGEQQDEKVQRCPNWRHSRSIKRQFGPSSSNQQCTRGHGVSVYKPFSSARTVSAM